jgi:hypothetical protein
MGSEMGSAARTIIEKRKHLDTIEEELSEKKNEIVEA